MKLGPIGRAWIGLIVAALVSAALPAAASADHSDDPEITRAPALSGSALVGSRLDAVGASWRGRPTLSVNWRWLRCDHPVDWRSCRLIDREWSSSYTVSASDLGKRLRVVLWISNRDGDAYALSTASSVVDSPPPPPPPPPPPLVSPPVVVPPVVPAAPTPQAAAPPRIMRPAPLVRIRGYLTRRGARLTLLTVRATKGARISVSCKGIGCPRVAPAEAAKLTRLRSYEGMFRAGTRIVVRVTRPGFVGKHTLIRIRRGKAPLRFDSCLYPGAKGPSACQTG